MERFFHAPGRGAYFEGWYFKLQTRGGEALALIPALHQDSAARRSASLQVITREGSWWLEYPEAEFGASAELLRIRAGANIFTEKGLRVSADAPGLRLRGAVGFGAFTRLVSDIMGPFRFLPGMECSHGVISMTHALEGALSINGRTLDFTGGTGYIETDRGRSFPRAYLWAQCAWGGHSGFMLSAATIPLPLGGFTGCSCACASCAAGRPSSSTRTSARALNTPAEIEGASVPVSVVHALGLRVRDVEVVYLAVHRRVGLAQAADDDPARVLVLPEKGADHLVEHADDLKILRGPGAQHQAGQLQRLQFLGGRGLQRRLPLRPELRDAGAQLVHSLRGLDRGVHLELYPIHMLLPPLLPRLHSGS